MGPLVLEGERVSALGISTTQSVSLTRIRAQDDYRAIQDVLDAGIGARHAGGHDEGARSRAGGEQYVSI